MKGGQSSPLQHAGLVGFGCLVLLLSLSFTAWAQADQPAPPTVDTPPATAQEGDVKEPRVSSLPLPPAQTVLVKDRKIVYYEAGKGDVVILLHGLGADSHHWAHNIGPLAQKFRVIALDQIGYGKSDKPVMRYTVGNFADYLHGFMEALQIPKASLVGNSLGGWVALDFSIRHPSMVEKLVLVDAAGLHPTTPLRRPRVDGKI